MKKLVVLGLAAALLVSVLGLAGCGSKKDTAKTDTGPALPAAVQKIKDSGKLRVGVKVDVPGFGLKNSMTGKQEGLEADMARQLAVRMGLTENDVEFTPVTADTRGTLLDNGQIDMVIATFTIKPERQKLWNFSQPYYTDAVGLLVEKKSGFTDLKSLDGKIIGVAQGATTKDAVQKEADKLGIKVKFSEFQTYPEISTALKAGKVDAFSVDRSILAGYLKGNENTRVILPDKFSPQDYGIATKKTNTELAKWVDDYLTEIKGNGELTKMLAKYGLDK